MDGVNLLTASEAFREMYRELINHLESGDSKRALDLAKRMAAINGRFIERQRHVMGLRESTQENPDDPPNQRARLLDPERN